MLKALLSNVTSKLDEHTLEVARKSSASLIVKILGMVVGLAVSVFLGRTLGAEGLGIINLANRIVSVLLVFTMFGMDNVLLKRIAIAFEQNDQPNIGNSIYTSTLINGLLAFIISAIGILFASKIAVSIFNAPDLKIPLIIALAMIIPQTFSRIFAAGLSGFRKIWQSNLVNETLSIWVLGLGLLFLHLCNVTINIINVALLYALGRLVTSVTISAYWRKLFPLSGPKKWIAKPMIKMAMPLLLVSATSIIASNADIIMLGWLSNTREVGLYSVAARLALLTSFFLQVSNASISPKLATLFAEGKLDEMRKMVKKVNSGLIIIAISSLLGFIIFGHLILSLWGPEFKEAYLILIILSIGQFINISTGCAGLLLVMCGHEKIYGYISLIFVSTNLILNYFLIHKYGAIGAAIATAISVGSENITKVIVAKIRTGVLTISIF